MDRALKGDELVESFWLHSGHDLGMMALLELLGVNKDGRWPPFAAMANLELYDGGLVRVVYLGEDVTASVDGCGRAVLTTNGLCPFAAFAKKLRQRIQKMEAV